MKLNINHPQVWNQWRENYQTLTSDEHLEFYEQIAQAFPEQKHFNVDAALRFLSENEIQHVHEIGGWTGDLALQAFKTLEVRSWLNYEICKSAIDRTLAALGMYRYGVKRLDSFRWFETLKPEIRDPKTCLLATHFIEHLSNQDFEQFLEFASHFDYVYFEAPLNDLSPADWTDYVGTHILTYPWFYIESLMAARGYRNVTIDQSCKFFIK
jgi:hypothetical protein